MELSKPEGIQAIVGIRNILETMESVVMGWGNRHRGRCLLVLALWFREHSNVSI